MNLVNFVETAVFWEVNLVMFYDNLKQQLRNVVLKVVHHQNGKMVLPQIAT